MSFDICQTARLQSTTSLGHIRRRHSRHSVSSRFLNNTVSAMEPPSVVKRIDLFILYCGRTQKGLGPRFANRTIPNRQKLHRSFLKAYSLKASWMHRWCGMQHQVTIQGAACESFDHVFLNSFRARGLILGKPDVFTWCAERLGALNHTWWCLKSMLCVFWIRVAHRIRYRRYQPSDGSETSNCFKLNSWSG